MGDSKACLPTAHDGPIKVKLTNDAVHSKTVCKSNHPGKFGRNGI